MRKKVLSICAAACSMVLSAQATEGVNLIGIGPVQQGTAGAGVASAKDSTWLLLNPAGLTGVGRQVDASFQLFAPVRTMQSSLNPDAGRQTDRSTFFIPSLSASLGCCQRERSYFGIGIYGTSGMGVKYGQPRVPGQRDRMTELSVTKLTLTYAHAFDNGFSIGAGPVFVLSRFRTDMMNPSFTSESGKWDEAVGIGAIVGVTQRITDRLTLGAAYMSEQFMTDFNDYNTLLADSLNFPQQVTVGLAFDIRPDLELALDGRWIGWSRLDTFGDQFGWDDQRIIKTGLTWTASERLTLRGGVSHGNSPIGKEDVFMNALFPAIMKTHVAGGFSYAFDRVTLHASFTHGFKESITDNTQLGGGTRVSMVQNSATLGLSWVF